jgi:hypothetical protein
LMNLNGAGILGRSRTWQTWKTHILQHEQSTHSYNFESDMQIPNVFPYLDGWWWQHNQIQPINVAGTTGTKEPALCIEAGYPMLLQVGSYCG